MPQFLVTASCVSLLASVSSSARWIQMPPNHTYIALAQFHKKTNTIYHMFFSCRFLLVERPAGSLPGTLRLTGMYRKEDA